MKLSNRTLLAGLILAGALCLPPAVRAADTTETTKPATGERGERLRERMQKIATELNLTDDQKQQLKPIVQAEIEKLKELHANKSLSREQKRAQFKAARAEFAPKVKNILTPEQFAKWEQLREEFHSEARQRLQK